MSTTVISPPFLTKLTHPNDPFATSQTSSASPSSDISTPVSSIPSRIASSRATRIYVPPLNYACVTPGLYRSGFPRPENFAFVDELELKSLIYLADQDFKEDTLTWAKKRNLEIFHFRVDAIKEPLVETNKEEMRKALEVVLDTQNWPILIHCNRGKHRAGLLCALVRRLQRWSLTMLFDEYARFYRVVGQEGGESVGRVADYEWIESFDLSGLEHGANAIDWKQRPA